MKPSKRFAIIALLLAGIAGSAFAQTESSSGIVRRNTEKSRNQKADNGAAVTDRMQSFYNSDNSSISDADMQWMRVIYRSIDLEKDQNAPLYFPEEPIEGQENLFRIIMRLLANNQIAAYEYLDGREIFTDQYRIKVRDILDRFYILYTEAKGSTEKNPKFNIDESDVPANEVLSYYIIEKWEFDTRNNRLRPRVEALCPVLHRSGDFGGEAVKYPMFWIKFSDIRPWLAQQTIFVNDDNNLPSCNYDDFFNLTMYDGEIYKTRNLKNRSMMQLYPDPDDRQRAQDSIQARLDNFEKKLWVPSREEVIAAREAREGKAVKADSTAAATVTEVAATETETKTPVRSTKRSTKKSSIKTKEPKVQKASSSSSATRSVRRRK
jgi:gliding motility associated protien GldN